MSNNEPSQHRSYERDFMRHVRSLLADPRLRLDTTRGAKAITQMIAHVHNSDRGVELKNLMIQMNLPDRELQNQMPVGEFMEVTLAIRKLLLFQKTIGRLRVVCMSPSKALLTGQQPARMTAQDVTRALSEMPPSLGGVPTTVILLSTAGFTLEAHELADRRPDRTLIMVQPNEAGGWSVFGPTQNKALTDLLDPEAEAEKSQRVRELIEAQKMDLLSSGIAADKLAGSTHLPLQLVEAELKSYAKANPGLVAKRLDGRVVLFREGSAPPTVATGGSDMPLIDRIRSLFARKGETEKKIAVLSEQRTALSQQLDRAYEEIGALEKKDASLRGEFKSASTEVTKRRISGQLVQLRKDIERRQQLVGVLNQRVNVVATHLHNLELVRQDAKAKLPDAEEIAHDAAAAEEMLADLQANTELADSVSSIAHGGMSAEEQAMYEELEREANPPAAAPTSPAPTSPASAAPTSGAPQSAPAQRPLSEPAKPAESANRDRARRAEPEAG
jgi:hypothetical protein